MRRRRGACSVCGTDRSIKGDGSIHVHVKPGDSPWVCEGSGKPPSLLMRLPSVEGVTEQMVEAAAEKLWIFAARSTEPWPPADPWDRDRYREVAGQILAAAIAEAK